MIEIVSNLDSEIIIEIKEYFSIIEVNEVNDYYHLVLIIEA